MYERSAIILEKYYNNMFGFDKKAYFEADQSKTNAPKVEF